MSEETPKIETVKSEDSPKITTTKKEKDPKRVEAGKHLAAISKAAREKKMSAKIETERNQENGSGDNSGINYGFLFGFLGTAVAIGSLYYTRKDYERKTKKLETIKEEPEPEPKHAKIKRIDHMPPKNSLDTFD